MNRYIIRIDGAYFVGFYVDEPIGKTSHGGWSQLATEITAVRISYHREDAKVLEGNVNLNSTFTKLYDRLRYGEFTFDSLEIERVK